MNSDNNTIESVTNENEVFITPEAVLQYMTNFNESCLGSFEESCLGIVPDKAFVKYKNKFFDVTNRESFCEKLLEKFDKLVEEHGIVFANKRLYNILCLFDIFSNKYHVYESKEACESHLQAFYESESTYEPKVSDGHEYYPMNTFYISDNVVFTYCLREKGDGLFTVSDTIFAVHRP